MTPREVVGKWIGEGAFPGASFAYGSKDRVIQDHAGRFTYDPESRSVDEETIWDLASVTKVMATTPAVLAAVDEGLIGLEDPVSRWIPETKLTEATIRHLLRHESGLRAYDSGIAGKISVSQEARSRILSANPATKVSEKCEYSCLGFVTLMAVVERATGMPFPEWIAVKVFSALGVSGADYCPSPGLLPRIPPTGQTDAWRRKLAAERGQEWSHGEFIRGTVHDPIAYALGGVSGNAGLFSTLSGVAEYAQSWLEGRSFVGRHRAEWTTKGSDLSSRALGWDTKSPTGSSAGTLFSLKSFGHTGYTGTCIWIDPEHEIWGVLLAHRVYPDETNLKISQARPEFFDAVFRVLRG